MINDDDLRVLRDLGFTPVIAEELGRMCVAWACLEWRLFSLFARLSDMPTALARTSFYSHKSTRNRTELILSTAAMVLRGSRDRQAAYKALDDEFGRIHRVAARRNAYIHDPWAMVPGDLESVCQMRLSGDDVHGEGERVRGRDIWQLTNSILTHIDRLYELDQRIGPLLAASLEKLDRTRSITQQFAKTKRRRSRPPAHQAGPSDRCSR